MVAPIEHEDDIRGEVLDERDLVDGDSFELTTPDGVDQEWLLSELYKDLLRGEHAKAVLAEAQMRRVIAAQQQLEHRTVEGLGQLRARVPLEVFLHWAARYGEDFWRQEDSLQYFEKRAGGGRGNPGFLVKTPPKPTIIVERTLSGADGAPESSGVRPAAVARPTAAEPARVRGRRGRWAT